LRIGFFLADGEKPAADLQVKPVAAVAAAPVEETKPLEPPPEFHFSATVPTISAQDMYARLHTWRHRVFVQEFNLNADRKAAIISFANLILQ
jgi:hypothetical protein